MDGVLLIILIFFALVAAGVCEWMRVNRRWREWSWYDNRKQCEIYNSRYRSLMEQAREIGNDGPGLTTLLAVALAEGEKLDADFWRRCLTNYDFALDEMQEDIDKTDAMLAAKSEE